MDVSEKQLLENARNGDEDAFREIVEQNKQRVAATIHGFLGITPVAEDIGQETFIRFFRNLNSFRGDAAISTYLTRIAINLSLNEIKRKKRWYQTFSNPEPEELLQLAGTDNSTSDREDVEFVRKAIQKLEPKFRSVIVLRLINGFSTQETATILEIPEGTVLSRLSRAQKQLKKVLTDAMEGEHYV